MSAIPPSGSSPSQQSSPVSVNDLYSRAVQCMVEKQYDQVLQICNHFLQFGLDILNSNPPLKFDIYFLIGMSYFEKGEHNKAEENFTRIVENLKEFESIEGLEDRLADIYLRRGECLRSLGDLERELRNANEALTHLRDPEDRYQFELVLAGFCHKRKEFKTAESYLAKALPYCLDQQKEQVESQLRNYEVYFGTDEAILDSLKSGQDRREVGVAEFFERMDCLIRFSDIERAVSFLEKGLKIAEEFDLQKVLWNFHYYLGYCHKENGDASVAQKEYEKALFYGEKQLDQDDPNLADILHGLSICLLNQGKNEQALELANRAFEVQKKNYGIEHPVTLESMLTIAGCYFESGDLEKALEQSETALGVAKKMHGEDHPTTKDLRKNIQACHSRIQQASTPETPFQLFERGMRFFKQGKYSEAVGKFEDALQKLKNAFEINLLLESQIFTQIGYCFLNQKNYPSAAKYFDQAIETVKNLDARYDVDDMSLTLYINLFESLVRVGDFNEVVAKANEALSFFQMEVLNQEHLFHFYMIMGTSYLSLNLHDNAADHYALALQACRKFYGENHEKTVGLMDRILMLYQGIGREDAFDALHQEWLEAKSMLLVEKEFEKQG